MKTERRERGRGEEEGGKVRGKCVILVYFLKYIFFIQKFSESLIFYRSEKEELVMSDRVRVKGEKVEIRVR